MNEEVEIIDLCARALKEFEMTADNVLRLSGTQNFSIADLAKQNLPEEVLWQNILSALEACIEFLEMKKLVEEMRPYIPRMKARVKVEFTDGMRIDETAKAEISLDGPINWKAIWIYGDGNCLPRALGKAFFNDVSKHYEIRVRIIFEGITNMDKYLMDDCLECGASYIHGNADLPTVFATFSDYYMPGQKLTKDTIHYIYAMEMYSCARVGSDMGLWQLAQASLVLGVPIHTIYPVRGESSIRNDFHRIFFPIDYPPTPMDDEPVVIMWTANALGKCSKSFRPIAQ